MKFILVGQPNSGKSTLFNQVSGYKAETGNFTGTSVTFTESKVRVGGEVVELVDLPGTYTLAGTNPAERVVFQYLLNNQYDCIINVIDATHLSLGLGITVELLELGRPMILVLNMIDEADRLGMRIDIQELKEKLGIPVLPMIASKGRGIRDVFLSALHTARVHPAVDRQEYRPELENQIKSLAEKVKSISIPLSPEAFAIKLIENDVSIVDLTKTQMPELLDEAEKSRMIASGSLRSSPELIVNLERNAIAATLGNLVIKQGTRKLTIRDRLDDYLLHPLWGYVFLILILFGFFQAVFSFGGVIEKPLLALASQIESWIRAEWPVNSLVSEILVGLLQGISGGLAIVLPYLFPFLIGLGLLEDVGYLPRIAFLMDTFMHRIGLHGAAILPFILGFGCNVPSIMSTRTLEDKKERFIAGALATLVPCSARLAVVFGLVAYYLGPIAAVIIYLFNLVVIAITGKLLSKILPEDTPGLILEMPSYRIPTLKAISQKTWYRIKEFIVEAWPILIAGSIVLSLMNAFNISQWINLLLKPITWLLGLPDKVGVPLVFGVLRKELSLVMLGQALGSMDFKAIMSPVQMITYTIFVIFYMPCLATLVTLRKELGTQAMWAIMGLTLVIATVSATLARFMALIFFG